MAEKPETKRYAREGTSADIKHIAPENVPEINCEDAEKYCRAGYAAKENGLARRHGKSNNWHGKQVAAKRSDSGEKAGQ